MLCQCRNCVRTSCTARKETGSVRCGRYKDTPFTNADRLREIDDNTELAKEIFKFCSELSCNYDFSSMGVLSYLNDVIK